MYYAVTTLRDDKNQIVEQNTQMDDIGLPTGLVEFYAPFTGVFDLGGGQPVQTTFKVKLNAANGGQAFADLPLVREDGRLEAAAKEAEEKLRAHHKEMLRQQLAATPRIQKPG